MFVKAILLCFGVTAVLWTSSVFGEEFNHPANLCRNAANSIELGNVCEAYMYYQDALKTDNADEKCIRDAKTFIAQKNSQCESGYMNIASERVENNCELGLKAENYASICNAVSFYRRAEMDGNTICHDRALNMLKKYGDSCRGSSMDEKAVLDISEGSDEICREAISRVDSRQYCEAAQMFIKALNSGITDSDCSFKANIILSEYAELCKIDASLVKSAKKSNIYNLCQKASKARRDNAICESYALYRMAVNEPDIAFEQCFSDAYLVVEAYQSKCQSSILSKSDSDKLCEKALDLKDDKEYCASLEYFKKAIDMNDASSSCLKAAELSFKKHAKKCGMKIPEIHMPSESESLKGKEAAEFFCREAAESKVGPNRDVCKSLYYYHKAHETGEMDEKCSKAAKMAIQQYSGKCNLNNKSYEISYRVGDIYAKETADELCKEAVKLSMNMKTACRAVSYFKRALATGFASEKCSKFALMKMQQLGSCEFDDNLSRHGANSEAQKKADDFCRKAAKARIGANKDVCKSLSYYQKAMATGAADEKCRKGAERMISKYTEVCIDSIRPVVTEEEKQVQKIAADLCQKAAEAKIKHKDVCKSFSYYMRYISIGGSDERCLKAAKMAVSQYSNRCRKE